MKAKRSKKYRKLMHQYGVTFGFREPYQVLLDSHFLRTVHSFKMDLIPALERTLQGKVKPFITKCSLAATMPSSESDSNSHRRPQYLPPPTVVPLRYCSHNEDDTPIDEASCLLSLLSPSAEAKKNKEHYVIATADPPVIQESSSSSSNTQQKRKRNSVAPQQPRYNLRRDARSIPGVPIIYVKRSVMVLEPMSGATENVREGFERGKLKTGVTSLTGKRKRDEEDPAPKTAKVKKVKGPNPLSVKKPKSRRDLESEGSKPASRAPDAGSAPANENTGDIQSDSGEQQTKAKRKRRHKSHRPGGEPSEVEASIPAES